jgi:predicted ribosome quality control (RQC) complex YloA/Tae2 family protein
MQLYVEIMGRRSNVMLVNPADSNVLACGYQVGRLSRVFALSTCTHASLYAAFIRSRQSDTRSTLGGVWQVSPSKSVRAVSVGQSYSLPPSLLNPMPSTTTTPWPEFLQRASLIPSHDLRKALLSAFRGFSPQLIDTMAAAAGLDSAAKVSPPAQLLMLIRGMNHLSGSLCQWHPSEFPALLRLCAGVWSRWARSARRAYGGCTTWP